MSTAPHAAQGAPSAAPDGSTYAAFAGAVVIGGINFIAVSFSNLELPPIFGATLRFALAGAIFLLLARTARVPLPGRRLAAGAALYGVLGFGVSYALLYYALVGLTAGTAAVVMAAAPLFTLIIAVLIGQERLTARGVVGGLLAIAGIGVLSAGGLEGGAGGAYLLAAVLGTVAAAASSVAARALRAVHPLNMNAIGMVAGTLLLAAASLALGESWALPREGRTIAAVLYLVLFGSVGLFQLFLYVIRRWSASATIYALTCMPLVAVLLGAPLLGQPITLKVVAGGALVIVAVYVGAISGMRKGPRAGEAAAERVADAPRAAAGPRA
jgi:drug/metabolite transporter (DMT)-like permease